MTIDEGYTKFVCEWSRSELPAFDELTELCRWRNALFDAGLIGHYKEHDIGFGNISVRLDGGCTFLISGTQTGHIANVDERHFALVTQVDVARNRVRCEGPVQASSESMTHAALYEIDSRIHAVVHVHSDVLWNCHLDVLPTTSSDIAYGTPGMADEFASLYRETCFSTGGIAVMGGHDAGLVSIGQTLAEAALRILDLQQNMRADGKPA